MKLFVQRRVSGLCFTNMKEEPTCTEIILLHSKGLYAKVEGVDGEQACDGVVLLLVAHVGAADTRLPQTQAAVGLRKRRTLRKHTCILNKETTFACFSVCVCVCVVPDGCG